MRKSKGFTLIELIITIAILGIIIIPLSSMVLTSVKFTKASSDKQRATNLAQRYMEQIKGADASIVDNNTTTTLHYDEGSFDVDCYIEPVTGYEFKYSSVSGENGSDSITCDYSFVFQDSNLIQSHNYTNNTQLLPQKDVIKPYIKIYSTDSNIEFILKDEEKKNEDEKIIGNETIIRSNEKENGKIKIRIDILRELGEELLIDVDNETGDILEFYFVKANTLSSEPQINLQKHGGKIRMYNDILKIEEDSLISDELNKRLYKVTVEVKDKKTGETLSVNKGYKTFLK